MKRVLNFAHKLKKLSSSYSIIVHKNNQTVVQQQLRVVKRRIILRVTKEYLVLKWAAPSPQNFFYKTHEF